MGELEEKVRLMYAGELPPVQKGDKPDKEDEDFKKELRGYRQELIKTNIAKEIMGTHKQEVTENKTSEQMGNLLQSVAASYNTLLGKVVDLQTRPTGPDPFFQHLVEEIKESKQKYDVAIERANENRQDPIVAISQYATFIAQLEEGLKKRLNIGEAQRIPSGDNVGLLLELEKMKMEHVESVHQWEVEGAERRRQWDKEDRRWEQEFSLKKMEYVDNKQNRERATDTLGDLLGSVIDGIDTQKGAEVEVASEVEEEAIPRPIRIPKSFKCSVCSNEVVVKEPEAKLVTCEGCKTQFEFVPKGQGEVV